MMDECEKDIQIENRKAQGTDGNPCFSTTILLTSSFDIGQNLYKFQCIDFIILCLENQNTTDNICSLEIEHKKFFCLH